jgi:DNA repair protein RecN (Recombination protein N)
VLTELSIRDIALIPQLRLRFGPGLHVLSGETGAGKSLVVGGLRLLCGEKAGPEVVRAGAERAVVEGVFEIEPDGWIARELARLGVECEDGELIVRREVVAAGRGRARINGAAVPMALLAQVGELLVDLHGQHDHQSLLRPSFQLDVLDEHAGAAPERTRFGDGLAAWKEAAADLDARERAQREDGARRELARFQLKELEEAKPQAGELAALRAELRRLENAEWLEAAAARLVERLADGEGAIGDVAGEAAQTAARAARHDPEWTAAAAGLESLAIAARELARDVRALGERAVHDPERLEDVRARVRLLEDLHRKYGPAEEDLLATWAKLREEHADPDAAERRVEELRIRVAEEGARLLEAGAALRARRKKAAGRLARAMEKTLAELGMEGTRFEARLAPRAQGAALDPASDARAGSSGLDSVEMLLAANAGEELRPLRAVASGGEISRVMLALKSVLGETRGTATMVFDEIDAGVGGRVANRVGELLQTLGERRQVLCITHLAAIASRARVHLRVAKETADGRTVSAVEPVAGEERVSEIARMLGGSEEDGVAREHARQLLEAAGG